MSTEYTPTWYRIAFNVAFFFTMLISILVGAVIILGLLWVIKLLIVMVFPQ